MEWRKNERENYFVSYLEKYFEFRKKYINIVEISNSCNMGYFTDIIRVKHSSSGTKDSKPTELMPMQFLPFIIRKL